MPVFAVQHHGRHQQLQLDVFLEGAFDLLYEGGHLLARTAIEDGDLGYALLAQSHASRIEG